MKSCVHVFVLDNVVVIYDRNNTLTCRNR